ncbi:TetR/AcrR family transcriptional regulator [Paenibacillus hodogayensis]|uniref:TetR/AcrR family transcriptional regulator n=1 Tax=Paenibacillus hodogayensis TaxID=279208 RepID=A0ABV5W3F2_9BACL
MEKKDAVRESIIAHALHLFNTKGFSQTSIQDIMEAASLPKGAIYRRFENKELIVLAAFERAGQILQEFFVRAVEQAPSTIDKLLAIAAIYQDAVHNPPIPGGCPLLNTAIESDGTFPELQKQAAQGFMGTIAFVQSIIEEGMEKKELRPDINSFSLASYLITSMEGAIMASRLTASNEHVLYNMEYTRTLLQSYSLPQE